MSARWGLLGLLVLALAAPSAAAVADKPVPGASYTLKQTVKKWKTWRAPEAPYNVIGVDVAESGRTVEVGWSIYTGHDCVYKDPFGGSGRYQDGWTFDRVPVKADGSFHALVHPPRGHNVKVQRELFETRGRFLENGNVVELRIRHQAYRYTNPSWWLRCGGKWVTYRIPIDQA